MRFFGTLRVSMTTAVVVAALLWSLHLTPSGNATHARAATQEEPEHAASVENESTQPFSPDDFSAAERAFPEPSIPPEGYPSGVTQAMKLRQTAARVHWRELGPTYAPNAGVYNPVSGKTSAVSGRATGLAVVPSTCTASGCGTMYLATAGGGVWKTTDGGNSWRPLMDNQTNLAVGAITLDPSNPEIVYVGTGEANHSGDSFHGGGIRRSTDGGQTWTTLGAKEFVNRAVAAIIVDPRTAGNVSATIYAISTLAASGTTSTGGESAWNNPNLPPLGFYVSRDGGQTWQLSNPPGADDGGQSLVMDPHNPDVLYAGFTPDRVSHPQASWTDLARANGIFKSTDDGKTWTHLTGGLPDTPFNALTVAVAHSNPNIVYAAYGLGQDTPYTPAPFGAAGHEAFYRSADGGSTWTALTHTPNVCGAQCSYDMPVVVNPTDPNVVYLGGQANYGYLNADQPECRLLAHLPASCSATVARTSDGGATWADLGNSGTGGLVHPDDHAIVLDPANPNVIYTATDGGLYWTDNDGAGWNDLNKGLGTLQFTGLAVGRNGTIYAGTQDNGTFGYVGSTTWVPVNGGDGGLTATDPRSSTVSFNSNFGPYLYRREGGVYGQDTYISAFAGDKELRGLGQFYEPYALAPSKPNVLYFGTYRVWRSETQGGTDGNNDGSTFNDSSDFSDWVPISFDLRCGKQPSDPTAVCSGATAAGAARSTVFGSAAGAINTGPGNLGIGAVAVAPTDPNVVVAGASNGRVWMTRNALTPVKTDHSCVPWTSATGYAMCDYLRGPVWQEIDRGLPKRYVSSITFAPHSSTTLYVTFSGFDQNTPGGSGHVFVSTNGAREWKNLTGKKAASRLPNLPVTDLLVNPTNGHLYVSADYGVYVSANGGASWQRMDHGLPAADVYQMQYFALKHMLIVATHGRGVWETPAP